MLRALLGGQGGIDPRRRLSSRGSSTALVLGGSSWAATGPGGRLLKGDVLAYIGQIENAYPSELASRFTKLSHLDLSNIKVMAKKEASKKTAAEAPALQKQERKSSATAPVHR